MKSTKLYWWTIFALFSLAMVSIYINRKHKSYRMAYRIDEEAKAQLHRQQVQDSCTVDLDSFRLDRIPVAESSISCGFGAPYPVQPEDMTLPRTGTNTLRNILGPLSETYVFNSVYGIVPGNCESIPYEKTDATTRLLFPGNWTVDIDNETGTILIPSDLPAITEEEIAEWTWTNLKEGGHVREWAETLQSMPLIDGHGVRLVGFRLDEIRLVSDKVFVAWRLVRAPPASDGSFLRLIFIIDRRAKDVTYSGVEVHEW